MSSKKAKKQTDRFKAGVYKFVEHFAQITGLEEIDRSENARGGNTTIVVTLKVNGGIPATRAAKIGSKMALHFPAWFCPTHYEMYKQLQVQYQRGEGTITVTGSI